MSKLKSHKEGALLNYGAECALIQAVTTEKIDIAIKNMPTNKAQGVDGYPIELFTKNWEVVKEEVYAVVQSFFATWKLLKKLNCTTITLVPKVPSPTQVKDYRPIACCNTLYKIIAKVITLRLKK